MNKIIFVFERLREPGSQRALMFLFGLFQLDQVQVDNWMGVLSVAFGVCAVFTPEYMPDKPKKDQLDRLGHG